MVPVSIIFITSIVFMVMIVSTFSFTGYVLFLFIGVNKAQLPTEESFAPLPSADQADIASYMDRYTGDTRFTEPRTMEFTRGDAQPSEVDADFPTTDPGEVAVM